MYGKLMNESLKALIENKKALFKALFIPTLVLIGIYFYVPNLIIQDGEAVFDENIKWRFGIIWILILYINMVIAISVHRIILIKDNISLFKSIIPSKIELRFFFKAVLFGILLWFIFMIFSLFLIPLKMYFNNEYIIQIALYVAIFITSIAFSIFSMVFPATAIGKKMSLFNTLKFTKNYKLLSFFMIVVFPMILSSLIGFIYNFVMETILNITSFHISALYVVVNLFVTVLIISCLSVTYSYIKEENDKKSLEQELVNKEEEN
ncbi:hypothetical protein [Aliarcobacter butzleri]|uniref:hypothetical protein n=1 Tax=Aliarcobacter butzleri TaxID=28197 RepID=UPI001EDAB3FB|nr:hypothetical protein [Aliarcobacter butzleri]MCG3660140.1 hypothetical protein [Aliarcobacter butzleri]